MKTMALRSLCIALGTIPAAAQTPFGPALIPTPGVTPQQVAIGDLDGDGRNDIVVASSAGGVATYRGTGGGAFQASAVLNPGIATNGYVDIELVDVDGDLALDVVGLTGLSSSTATVFVWINQGAFLFSAATSYASGISTGGLAIADVSGDGFPDIAVSNAGTASGVVLRINTGTGTFGAQQFIAVTSARPNDVSLGDVDGDGDVDIVTVNEDATISVLANQPGGFSAPAFQPLPGVGRRIALADFDSDGDLDAAVVIGSFSAVVVWNSGFGAFGASVAVGSANALLRRIIAADLDADGRFDITFLDLERGMHVVRNLGGGAFAAETYYAGGAQYGIAFGDVDGDARLDLVLARDAAQQIGIQTGDGQGSFGPKRIPLGAGIWNFGRADVSGDGRPDLVGVDGSGSLSVRLGLAAGGFGAEASFPIGYSGQQLWLVRFDTDAFLDALVFGPDSNVRVLLGNGAGGFGASAIVLDHVTYMKVGDFNGDGLADVVFNNSVWPTGAPAPISSGVLRLNNGAGGFTGGMDAINQTSAYEIGDLNEDGAQDVLRHSGSSLTAWMSNGTGGFTLQTLPAATLPAAIVDLNEDGHLDVVQWGPKLLLPGDGMGHLGAPLALTGPVSSGFFDLNGDGHTDGIATFPDAALYERTGPLQFVDRGGVLSPGGIPVFADEDGDGRPDMWLSSNNPSCVLVFHNRGPVNTPVAYCTAKTTSNGCVPAIAWSGVPSASATGGFTISCTNAINNAPGLLVYSPAGRLNVPFQGGTLCVGPSIFRGPIVLSGGNPGPMDCSGVFALDFNAFAHGLAGGLPIGALVVPATSVTAQWYGRDAFSIGGAMLSDGIDFVVGP